ncbi:MAG TPA: transcription antitermination factor NusB [Fimbriimonadales bacterium]|nr:transcription antitermination factor NusB [Fimbriimonadales bacterium]
MSSNSRRRARYVAFRALYQMDIAGVTIEEALKDAQEQAKLGAEGRNFSARLALGAAQHLEEIDSWIEKLAEGYSLERLAAVDRAILRLGLYELLYEKETPPAVVINEAVELAKEYSTEHSGAFVNGILGTFHKLRQTESASPT